MQQRSISELKQTVKHQKDLILQHLEKYGATSAKDIRHQCKLTVQEVKNRVIELRKARKISCYRSGDYQYLWVLGDLTQDEVAALEEIAQEEKSPSGKLYGIQELPSNIRGWFGFNPSLINSLEHL